MIRCVCAAGWKDAAGSGACLDPSSDLEGNGWEKRLLKRKACSDLSPVHANNNNNNKKKVLGSLLEKLGC